MSEPLLVELMAIKEEWDKGGRYSVLVFEHSDHRDDEFEVGEVYQVEVYDQVAAKLRTDPCDHEWVDARNKFVISGELCIKCNAIREGNHE